MVVCLFFFFKQKTAYEMRISDWSSDVCSADLECAGDGRVAAIGEHQQHALGHPLAEHREERPCEIGAAPFAGARILVEMPEGVPIRLGDEIGRASCRERGCQYV